MSCLLGHKFEPQVSTPSEDGTWVLRIDKCAACGKMRYRHFDQSGKVVSEYEGQLKDGLVEWGSTPPSCALGHDWGIEKEKSNLSEDGTRKYTIRLEKCVRCGKRLRWRQVGDEPVRKAIAVQSGNFGSFEGARKEAWDTRDRRIEKDEELVEASKQAAREDLPAWEDAIKRGVALGEEGIYFYFHRRYDIKHLRRAQEKRAPLLKDWSRFCEKAGFAYARELERLLGPPFTVSIRDYLDPIEPDKERYDPLDVIHLEDLRHQQVFRISWFG